jgi:predicted nucleic acid-binding protein
LIVVDASVVLAWFLEDNESALPALRYVEEIGAYVPGNFHSEVVHGFLSAERQRRLGRAAAERSLGAVLELLLDVRFPDPTRVMTIAREHRLTGYDATYLALAMEHGLKLATADATLRKAADAMNLSWSPASDS